MKKSLWITAAVMAVGIGMSAHADSAALGQWSFEGVAVGTQVTPAGGAGAGYTNWTAGTNNGPAYITNASPSGVSYPIAGGPGTNVLYFEDSVTNQFNLTAVTNRFFTDFLLKPGQLESTEMIANLDANAHLAFYFDTSSNLVLLHGDAASGNWKTSTFDTVEYPANAWLRISIDQDYKAGQDSFPPLAHPMFSIYVNGTNLVHDNGYTRTGNVFYATGEGPWFPMKAFALNMNALVGMGIGMLDDVVVTTNALSFGSPAPEEIGVLAATMNAAYGSIAPSGYQLTTNGVRTFTLTVSTNMCYVMGLTVGGVQVFTNTDLNASAVNYNVTYAQASTHGTNVVALFAAKSGTSGSYLDDYFNIGSVGYPDFIKASTNDADGDTFTDLQEAICGTDPTNALSFLMIDDITIDGSGNVVIEFEGSSSGAATNYLLGASVTVNGTYDTVTNITKGVKETKTITLPPGGTKKFYKVVVPYSGQ